ncbi:MAG: PEP-CTERM sorting domain-containing protein [Akkermansia sp.]|nr:PEP-CTERM sorting domain-containing protein [Akkermansia sp.]
MKKTIIALIAMTGISGAESLTLTSPTDGKLESGNAALTWSEEIAELQSWELNFTLLDAALANAALFGTRQSGYEAGIVLNVKSNGGLMIYNKSTTDITNNSFQVETDAGWVTASTNTNITLSFVADVDTSGTVVGGTFTLTSGTNSKIIDMGGHTNLLGYTSIKKDGGTRFYTAQGDQKFYNITVSQLSNRVIPEPATATLSLLALAGLAARRRRK